MDAVAEVRPGYRRQWVRCRKCGREAYYDYIPYSLANPVMNLPCGHDVGVRFNTMAEPIDGPSTAHQPSEG